MSTWTTATTCKPSEQRANSQHSAARCVDISRARFSFNKRSPANTQSQLRHHAARARARLLTAPRACTHPLRCGSVLAVSQLLQCSGNMVVDLAPGDSGLCALDYRPALEVGTLRALPLFPCRDVFSYAGLGPDAQSPGARARRSRSCV